MLWSIIRLSRQLLLIYRHYDRELHKEMTKYMTYKIAIALYLM